MSNVSGLFKDLTTVKKARNGRLASWDQRGKNQDYWEIALFVRKKQRNIT